MKKRINYQFIFSLICTVLVIVVAFFVLLVCILISFNQYSEEPAIEGYDLEILILIIALISILGVFYYNNKLNTQGSSYHNFIT
ncbi:MAG: hypothetical protein ACFFBH_15515 [Promethearchaeota archaeon]